MIVEAYKNRLGFCIIVIKKLLFEHGILVPFNSGKTLLGKVCKWNLSSKCIKAILYLKATK